VARLRRERHDYIAREDAGYRAATALLLRQIYKYIPGPGRHLVINGRDKPCYRQPEGEDVVDPGARNDVYSQFRNRPAEPSPTWSSMASPQSAELEPFDEEDNEDGEDEYVVRENRVGRLVHVPAPSAAIPEYVKDAFEEATKQLTRKLKRYRGRTTPSIARRYMEELKQLVAPYPGANLAARTHEAVDLILETADLIWSCKRWRATFVKWHAHTAWLGHLGAAADEHLRAKLQKRYLRYLWKHRLRCRRKRRHVLRLGLRQFCMGLDADRARRQLVQVGALSRPLSSSSLSRPYLILMARAGGRRLPRAPHRPPRVAALAAAGGGPRRGQGQLRLRRRAPGAPPQAPRLRRSQGERAPYAFLQSSS